MKNIEVPDAVFTRLQKLAVPLVDTPVTVLERLLNHYEERAGPEAPAGPSAMPPQAVPREGQRQPGAKRFAPKTPPSLRHTRVISADFAGRKAYGWNSLVREAHIEAVRRFGSVEAVRRVTKSQVMFGRATSAQEKKGYRYVAEINASIQNVGAEYSWSNTLRLAKMLKAPVEVEFEWLQRSEAAHPGKTGRLVWKPKEE